MSEDIKSENPIRLKHLALTNSQWLTILHYTANDGTVIADTLDRDKSTIEADFMHSKATNERIAQTNAADLAIRLLRSGVKITFLDGDKSLKIIQKLSPPLYDKFYSQSSLTTTKEAI